MSVIRPFAAVRPTKEYAANVAALPYDVMNSAEAKKITEGNPLSFLHVDKAEIDLPDGTDLYSDAVYEKAAENLSALSKNGICIKDEKPMLYIYRQIMNGRAQTGIVGCASIDDYTENIIRKHELTRADKEADRIRHVDTCNANTGPIFLCYPGRADIDAIVKKITVREAEYDFTAGDGIRNIVWLVDSESDINALTAAFAEIPALYIADGHHRCASAVKVGKKRRAENPNYTGNEEFNFFLAVCFKAEELEIMDYNRLLKDLNGLSEAEYMTKLTDSFEIEPSDTVVKPSERHTFGMYLNGKWHKLKAREGTFDESDPVSRLDVSILQKNCIAPIFGIEDPRTDKRIDFVGGIRGLGELEKRCATDMKVAFSMFPTTLDDLMAIADAGLIMPPKSTWFEPKLLSGLFIHELR